MVVVLKVMVVVNVLMVFFSRVLAEVRSNGNSSSNSRRSGGMLYG